MRQHMGYHLLCDASYEATASMPCGICGGESAQYSPDLTQVPGCATWLTKTSQPVIQCKLAGEVKFSIAVAAKVHHTHPCTNRPLKCPTCPSKPGVIHWKLNMTKHFARSHVGTTIPPDFLHLLSTSDDEIRMLRQFGARPGSKVLQPSPAQEQHGEGSVHAQQEEASMESE
jgi:hypothetical protein